MILLSFIGKGVYGETIYKFEDKQSESTCYVVKALKELFSPNKVFLLMTNQAKQRESELKNILEFETISIPEGKNETELWEIFQQVIEKIPEKEELILDVTHGFRSLAILLLAILAYLKATKQVSVKYILYGAYDARENEVAPIFNLMPFMDLINWSFATENFLQKGDASLVSSLIKNIHSQAYRNKNDYLPKGLQNIGNTLENISKAFSVVRPKEIIEQAQSLPKQIEESYKDVNSLSPARPFQFLLDKIKDRFQSFLPKEKTISLNSKEEILIHAEILKYYLETQQYQQAITLARELIVSHVCILNNLDMMKERARVEGFLNLTSDNNLQIPEELKKLWGAITDSRNDINHAGMRENPAGTTTLIRNIETYCKDVIELLQELRDVVY